ncbi:hypothetical protein [Daejeonella oryzae]|uniref:hypothetical protein n=1 Tax=Daejeonella oryzae TaxID=1122943 RepID=UPI0003F4E9B6|nr:hypothetical protein [Daejeonella oryzae]
MIPEENKEENVNNQDSHESQSQNNNGNIGRQSGKEEDSEPAFSSDGKSTDDSEKPVNEEGVGENQKNHWTGNYGQKSSNMHGSGSADGFRDQNLSNGSQQNQAANHVTNAGGTSQEDLENGKTGLKEE